MSAGHVQLAHGEPHPPLRCGRLERDGPGEVPHGGDHGMAVSGR